MDFNYKLQTTNHKLERGFTLIEVLVALSAFSIILLIIGTVFGDVLVSQRRVLNAQKVEENLSLIMEAMTREIRVAQPTPGTGNFTTISDACTAGVPAAASTLDFYNSAGQRIVYSLSGTTVYRSVDGINKPFSSNNIEFTRLQFCIRGISIYGKQPRVTIIASVRSQGNNNQQITEDYQTTVSLRYLGI